MLFLIINHNLKKRRFKHFERSQRLRVVNSKYAEKINSGPQLAVVIPPTKARTHASVTSSPLPSPLRQVHRAQSSPPQSVRGRKLSETLRLQTPIPGSPLSASSSSMLESPWTNGSGSDIENEKTQLVQPDQAMIQHSKGLVRGE